MGWFVCVTRELYRFSMLLRYRFLCLAYLKSDARLRWRDNLTFRVFELFTAVVFIGENHHMPNNRRSFAYVFNAT